MNLIIIPTILVTVAIIMVLVVRMVRLPLHKLILVAIGSILGLLLGALISIPLSNLPAPFGTIMPLVVSLVLTVGVVVALLGQSEYIASHFPFLQKVGSRLPSVPEEAVADVDKSVEVERPKILVDTSVIIDGRIADIAKAGFIHAKLLVPRFVLAELQNIADSEDAMRRGRGRRGLEILNQLRSIEGLEVEIYSGDVSGVKEVDAKLIALARDLKANVLTTDYNLNRVAQIEGIRVLNINELANAIRPVVLPGEEMVVKIVQVGKEKGQGVGYLADGTMIVVEHGDGLIGQEVATEVTRVFQTVAGKMIFAVPKLPESEPVGRVKSKGRSKA